MVTKHLLVPAERVAHIGAYQASLHGQMQPSVLPASEPYGGIEPGTTEGSREQDPKGAGWLNGGGGVEEICIENDETWRGMGAGGDGTRRV